MNALSITATVVPEQYSLFVEVLVSHTSHVAYKLTVQLKFRGIRVDDSFEFPLQASLIYFWEVPLFLILVCDEEGGVAAKR